MNRLRCNCRFMAPSRAAPLGLKTEWTRNRLSYLADLKSVFSAAGVTLREVRRPRMKTHRIFVVGIIAVCLSADAALAQDWPTRPVTLVVPFGAGGSSDVIGRVVAE